MEAFVERCTRLGQHGRPSPAALAELLVAGDLDPASVRDHCRSDPARPYGRRVFLESGAIEGMIATWSRAFPCAPHDHGGSSGGVRVVQGAAAHRVWRVTGGRLSLVREERVRAGEVIACGPDLVHSMMCAGEAEPLVTLHVYADPISHMVVYDRATERTFVVDGGCGAWVPLGEPHLVHEVHEGFRPPSHVAAGLRALRG